MGPPKLIYCGICSVYLIKKRPFLELKFYYDIVYLTSPFIFFFLLKSFQSSIFQSLYFIYPGSLSRLFAYAISKY